MGERDRSREWLLQTVDDDSRVYTAGRIRVNYSCLLARGYRRLFLESEGSF